MPRHNRTGCWLSLSLFLDVIGGGSAWGQPSVKRELKHAEGSAELGMQATVVGSGGDLSTTFLGAVLTLQGSHYGPLAAVFQVGLGAGLGDDPADPEKTRVGEQGWMALGARFRPLTLLSGAPTRLDLFVGPLLGTLFNHDVVIFTVAAELGAAYRIGRVRLSLSGHFGWADVLHQALPGGMKASWCAGGLLSAGLGF